jgi:hypothetical protein
VLAAAGYAATGHIGLAPIPDGFQTPPFGANGAYLAVDGTDLIAGDVAGARRTRLTTIRAAESFAGITPGAPAHVYQPATPLDLDQPLLIDPGAARLLAGWYGLGGQGMSRFAADIPDEQPSAAVLWPEHFDLGITAGRSTMAPRPATVTAPSHICAQARTTGRRAIKRSGIPRSGRSAPSSRSAPPPRPAPSRLAIMLTRTAGRGPGQSDPRTERKDQWVGKKRDELP